MQSQKKSQGWFPWKFASFSLFVLLIFLIRSDIAKHGSFKESNTGQFLQDIGGYNLVENAANNTIVYSTKAYNWGEKNVPIYYESARKHIGPYIKIGVKKCGEGWTLLCEASAYAFDYLSKQISFLLDKANDQYPGLKENVTNMANNSWKVFLDFSNMMIEKLKIIYMNGYTWINDYIVSGVGDLAIEDVKSMMLRAMQDIQKYAKNGYNWIGEQFHVKMHQH